jgi:hypothetical protein
VTIKKIWNANYPEAGRAIRVEELKPGYEESYERFWFDCPKSSGRGWVRSGSESFKVLDENRIEEIFYIDTSDSDERIRKTIILEGEEINNGFKDQDGRREESSCEHYRDKIFTRQPGVYDDGHFFSLEWEPTLPPQAKK